MSTKKALLPKNNLHYAYVLIGERQSLHDELFQFFENEMDIATAGNPDFSYFEFNNFGIDDARALGQTQSRKSFANGNDGFHKFFVIALNSITEEAQNALLKVFEEPTADTHFFILTAQNNFLPTLLSRVEVISVAKVRPSPQNAKVSPWQGTISERLALIVSLAGDITDEKKTKQDSLNLVSEIESELAKDVKKNHEALQACQSAREALMSRGAMIKMILENLMLQI